MSCRGEKLSAAARKMGLTQPSLSKHIKNLEGFLRCAPREPEQVGDKPDTGGRSPFRLRKAHHEA